MKLIIQNATNRVAYAVENYMNALLTETLLVVGEAVATDLNKFNATIIENVELPEDFEEKQWTYTEGVFVEYIENNSPIIDLEKEKERLYVELDFLSNEMATVILKCRLNNDPEPDRLTQIIVLCRAMYPAAKNEIESLTEETVTSYILRSPKYEQLLNLLKTFL